MSRSVRVLSAFVLLATAGCPFFGGKDPLIEGCEYAVGLTKKCNAADGARWFEMPAGYVTEQLASNDAAAASISDEVRKLAESPQAVSSQIQTVDAFDRLIVSRYLLSYSDRGAPIDCINFDARRRALDMITATDSVGLPIYLQFGPRSKLTSRVFRSLFASAELKTQLEADLTQALGNAESAKIAANAAFNAMKKKLEEDVAVGTYRYVTVRSFPQLWRRLSDAGMLNQDCVGRSIGQGIVVVGLDKRDLIVERATGVDLKAALQATVDAAKLNQAVAAAQASLNAQISMQSQRSLRVNLDHPAVRPLRWKPDIAPSIN